VEGRGERWTKQKFLERTDLKSHCAELLFLSTIPPASAALGRPPNQGGRPSLLLLIRLFQQATTGSMNECLGRDFQKACGSFNRSLLPKKHANGIWPPAV